MLLDGDARPVWQRTSADPARMVDLLRGAARLADAPAGQGIRAQLGALVAGALDEPRAVAVRAAAIDALAALRPDAATFARLAREVDRTADAAVSTAAIRALARLPRASWPDASAVDALLQNVIATIEATPPARRTQAAATDAIQFAEALTSAVPADAGLEFRRTLRRLGVQVVAIGTIPEQMLYDLRWFAVEKARPVQIVLSNREAMPHNVVVGQPGSIERIATLAAALPLPADPAAKAYVPASPLVVASTRLLREGEVERLNFTAPATPGEYVFLCTFPGHATRMYGVMLVVDSMDQWDAAPTVPIDPVTKAPFTSQRHPSIAP